MKAATVRLTPPAAAAAAALRVTLIQTAAARSRAKREGRRSKKTPVGITAPRLSHKSRVTEPPLAGAGHRRGLKRSPEITDRRRRRGADIAARRTTSDQRETKREGGRAAGTGREPAAPKPPQTDAGAARPAGRRGAGASVTAEMLRGPEAMQMEGRAEQLRMEGAEAGRGGAGAGAGRGGAGAGRGGIEAKAEFTGNTDPSVSLWSVSVTLFTCRFPRAPLEGSSGQTISCHCSVGKIDSLIPNSSFSQQSSLMAECSI